MSFLSKAIPAIFFWGIFGFVVFKIPYPESLTQASLIQLIPFFVSLYLALVFTSNIFLKNILSSSSISLGLIFLLILKALDSLNIVTGVLTTVAAYLLFSYFQKIKKRSPSTLRYHSGQASSGSKNLTKLPKIPKLTSLRRNKH